MNLETIKTWGTTVMLAVALATVTSCGSNNDSVTGVEPGPGGARELNSGNLAFGDTYEHRFSLAAAGTFRYHCVHHPMNGSVQVSTTAADTLATVNINISSGPFPGASVRPGGRVVWINNTSELHTVTSD